MTAPQVEGSSVKEFHLKASTSDNRKQRQTFIIYEEEDDVQGNISSYLKEIDQMESTLAALTNDFPKSVQLKQNKHNEKIAKTKRKITSLFKDTTERLKQKEQKLLHELDQIKNNMKLKLDRGDVIIGETKQKLSEIRKYLERNLNVWNNKIFDTNNNNDRKQRKERKLFIVALGGKTTAEFKENQSMINGKIQEIKHIIHKNKSFTSDIEYIYNEHEYNEFINNCDCFGKIVTDNGKYEQNLYQEKEEKKENNEMNVANELQNKDKITQKTIYWIFNVVFVVWYLWSQVWIQTRDPIYIYWDQRNIIVGALVSVSPLYLMIFHLCTSSGLKCTALGQWIKCVLIIIGNLIFVLVISVVTHTRSQCHYKLVGKSEPFRMVINSCLMIVYLSDVVFICFMYYMHRKYCIGNKFIAAIGSIMALMISYQLLNHEFPEHFERIIIYKDVLSSEDFIEPHGMMYLWYLGVFWFVDCN